MKKLLPVLLAVVLVMTVFVPTASAWRRGGCFGCGFGFGFFTGAVVGTALAAPFYYYPRYYPYYYYPPYPYYPAYPSYVAPPAYAAPQPSCYSQQGYWQQAPVSSGGFTTYQNVWVPPQTVCR